MCSRAREAICGFWKGSIFGLWEGTTDTWSHMLSCDLGVQLWPFLLSGIWKWDYKIPSLEGGNGRELGGGNKNSFTWHCMQWQGINKYPLISFLLLCMNWGHRCLHAWPRSLNWQRKHHSTSHFPILLYIGTSTQCCHLHCWVCYRHGTAVCDSGVTFHWILCKYNFKPNIMTV